MNPEGAFIRRFTQICADYSVAYVCRLRTLAMTEPMRFDAGRIDSNLWKSAAICGFYGHLRMLR